MPIRCLRLYNKETSVKSRGFFIAISSSCSLSLPASPSPLFPTAGLCHSILTCNRSQRGCPVLTASSRLVFLLCQWLLPSECRRQAWGQFAFPTTQPCPCRLPACQ